MTHKEALTRFTRDDTEHGKEYYLASDVDALLAQPEQEPVAHREGFWCKDLTCKKCYSADFRFKHTTPPQREE